MIYSAEEKELNLLKESGEAPDWYTVKSYITISKGYRQRGETPKGMYKRVCDIAAEYLGEIEMAPIFFDRVWRNWLCPASPVLSNTGIPTKGLPISCFGVHVGDSIRQIMGKAGELAALTKNGGGVGINFQDIRPKGSMIRDGANGHSDGIIPFAKIFDSTISGISQGSTRRGAASVNLNIDHEDWPEFVRMRRPEGDVNRQCGNLHHCTVVNDDFMQRVWEGDFDSRGRWSELLKARMETGEPYIMYADTVNRGNPESYKKNGLKVDQTNICSEITLYADDDHSYVCCLSSLNLSKWDEWKDTDLPEIAVKFLNGIINYFIAHSEGVPGLECARRSAIKGRAIGVGVLGWHTLLQEKRLPFAGFETMMLNRDIFSTIQRGVVKASKELAEKYGEPEWCKGTGMYNTHLTAIAPTRSNSIISGGVSAGIEPINRNVYVDVTAKGSFYEKNPVLESILEERGYNTKEVWQKVAEDNGSVQGLRKGILTDEEKKALLTAFEIDQEALVRQAAQRQPFICQSQSLTLYFPQGTDPVYFNRCHLLAWKLGVKTLYYCKSTSGIKADRVRRETTIEECESCSG